MGAGAMVAFVWGRTESLASQLYEIVPGFFTCLIVAIVVSLITYKPNKDIEQEFDETIRILNEERK